MLRSSISSSSSVELSTTSQPALLIGETTCSSPVSTTTQSFTSGAASPSASNSNQGSVSAVITGMTPKDRRSLFSDVLKYAIGVTGVLFSVLGIFYAIKSYQVAVRSNDLTAWSNMLAQQESCRTHPNNLYLQNSTICQEMRLRHDFDNVGRRWLVRSDVRLISYRLLRLLLSWLNVALVAGLIHCVLLLHARGKFAKPTPCFTDLPLNSLRSWNNILGLWRYPHERIRVSSNVRYSDVDTRVCQAYYKLISWRKFIFSVYDLSSWSYKNYTLICPIADHFDDQRQKHLSSLSRFRKSRPDISGFKKYAHHNEQKKKTSTSEPEIWILCRKTTLPLSSTYLPGPDILANRAAKDYNALASAPLGGWEHTLDTLRKERLLPDNEITVFQFRESVSWVKIAIRASFVLSCLFYVPNLEYFGCSFVREVIFTITSVLPLLVLLYIYSRWFE